MLLAGLLFAGLLLAVGWALGTSRSPGPIIFQEFQAPVNAPINVHISADLQAEVDAKVQR